MSDPLPVPEEETEFSFIVQIGSFLMFFLIISYLVIGAVKEATGTAFGHEASYIVAIGFLISFAAFKSDSDLIQENITFNDNVLFYFCIPPIVFASGYNMRRKRFFQNMDNIMIFGVLGTLTTYIFFASMTYWIHSYGWMKMWDSSSE